MMNILITNDDGYASPSLAALADWTAQFANVTVIAPREEQSGKSHSIDFHVPIEIKRVALASGREAWSVASTPADCVRFAVLGFGMKFDLVLSGVNKGQNLGHDVNYSGTAGAVTEAAMHGIRGVAVSASKKSLENAVANFDKVYNYFIENHLFDVCKTYNVNFPSKEVRGIEITRLGGVRFSDRYIPQGDGTYQPEAYVCFELTGDKGIDLDAINQGYISVTPLTWSRTDYKVLEMLK